MTRLFFDIWWLWIEKSFLKFVLKRSVILHFGNSISFFFLSHRTRSAHRPRNPSRPSTQSMESAGSAGCRRASATPSTTAVRKSPLTSRPDWRSSAWAPSWSGCISSMSWRGQPRSRVSSKASFNCVTWRTNWPMISGFWCCRRYGNCSVESNETYSSQISGKVFLYESL